MTHKQNYNILIDGMLVYEFKLKGKEAQFSLIDEAIRTCQFIRNKALRYWLDNKESKPNETDLCALVSEKGASMIQESLA